MIVVTMSRSLCGNTLGKALEFPTKETRILAARRVLQSARIAAVMSVRLLQYIPPLSLCFVRPPIGGCAHERHENVCHESDMPAP